MSVFEQKPSARYSIAERLRDNPIFNHSFVENLRLTVQVKEFRKMVNI